MENNIETKRHIFETIFKSFKKLSNDYLINDKQKDILENCFWEVSGVYDGEINQLKYNKELSKCNYTVLTN